MVNGLTGHLLVHRVRPLTPEDTILVHAIADGILTAPAPRALPLSEAATAHRDFEARASSGSLVLLP